MDTGILHGPIIHRFILELLSKMMCLLVGMKVKDIKSKMPDEYKKWKEDPFLYRFPGGESYMDLCHRLSDLVPLIFLPEFQCETYTDFFTHLTNTHFEGART